MFINKYSHLLYETAKRHAICYPFWFVVGIIVHNSLVGIFVVRSIELFGTLFRFMIHAFGTLEFFP